jgi:hypothetical protein
MPARIAKGANLLLLFAAAGRLADHTKFFGLSAERGSLKPFGGEAAFEKFTDCRGPTRHTLSEAEIIEDRKLFAWQHNLKALRNHLLDANAKIGELDVSARCSTRQIYPQRDATGPASPSTSPRFRQACAKRFRADLVERDLLCPLFIFDHQNSLASSVDLRLKCCTALVGRRQPFAQTAIFLAQCLAFAGLLRKSRFQVDDLRTPGGNVDGNLSLCCLKGFAADSGWWSAPGVRPRAQPVCLRRVRPCGN